MLFNMSMEINQLPEKTQKQIKETLKAYHKVYVEFENGEYHVNTGLAICAKYPADHKYIGEVNDSDIYTKEELQENYINTFYEYPPQYRGKRDYNLLKQARETGNTFKLVDGQLVLEY